MKKEIKILFAIILLAVLIAGCSSYSKESANRPKEIKFHTGTQGVVMNFMKNAPPDRMFDGDKVDFVVEVKNNGAYPETDSFQGYLYISGYDVNAFQDQGWDGGNLLPSTLQGITENNPVGGYATKTFKATVKVPFEGDSYSPTIVISSCYTYKTIAEASICIDPEPYRTSDEPQVCSIHDVSLGGGQGAPVAVTRVDEDVTRDKVIFKIYIRNSGGGRVFTTDAFNNNKCPSNLDFSDVNKVLLDGGSLGVQLPGAGQAECTPRGTYDDPIRLVDNNGVITCTFNKPITSGPAYTTTLQMNLVYGYTSTIQKTIKIINIK
ncbi:hypothetical protein HYU07_03770 [Candidatus Woesearchaeota archaeon]|nr:hypothetical protein [Candidatus Woesearchaeota archaeon]